MEANQRLSSSSKGRVRENFIISQQTSTFAREIRIELAESTSMPRCWSIAQIMLVNYTKFFWFENGETGI
jgi:hypothetical protein